MRDARFIATSLQLQFAEPTADAPDMDRRGPIYDSISNACAAKTWPVLASAAVILSPPERSPLPPPNSATGPSEVVFLAQLVILMLVGRLLGEAMQRIGQPAVMGQLLAGILLGPSVLGRALARRAARAFPARPGQKAMLDAVSQLGILLLLLLTGMETDLKLVSRSAARRSACRSPASALPFACGLRARRVAAGTLLPAPDKRLITSLFLGTALSISSVKIVATVVREMNFIRRNVGQVIVASAIIDDTIGWIIIAITFGLAQPAPSTPSASPRA